MCGIEIRGQAIPLVYSLLITAYQFVIILSTSSSLLSSTGPETSRLSLCFSCASSAYLSLWNQLMHHYFPPKNFTDRCWEPDSEIGTVPCRGSCFIVVEEIYEHFSTHAVMRGCMNRFLLFGLDEDVRDALTDKSECRTTDRRLLHLVALSPQTDLSEKADLEGDNVLMYGIAMQLCQYGLCLVNRSYFFMQRISSDVYVDFLLRYTLLDDICLIHATCHSLELQESEKTTGVFMYHCSLSVNDTRIHNKFTNTEAYDQMVWWNGKTLN
ncbi:Phosphoglucosamine mutase [Dirofilaria immitis]